MTIRWGIIGCGDVTERKSGPAFQKVDGSRLVAVMRRDGAKAEDYARRHNVPYWYDRAEAVIEHTEVDAIYIATPPGSHLEYALAVAAAGKPAYVEKPMARNTAECMQMNAAFAAAGLPLYVAFYRRALPRFVKAKELVAGGRLGTVTMVRYHYASPAHRRLDPHNLPWRVQAAEAGGGLFLDLGCHTLDILDFILGSLQNVVGRAANLATNHDVEDVMSMEFLTVGGAVGTASWNFAADSHADMIEIEGTDGRILFSTFGDGPVQLRSGEHLEEFDLPNPIHIQQPLIQTIMAELHGNGQCASTGQSAIRTAQVMDTVLTDYYGGRDDAFWLRPETWPGRRSL